MFLTTKQNSLVISADKLKHRLKYGKITNLQSWDDMSVFTNVWKHAKGDDNKVGDVEANDD